MECAGGSAEIKARQAPSAWTEQPRTLAQKYIDARWTKKGGKTFYGYNDHVRTDASTVPITDCAVTPTTVHNSEVLRELVGPQDRRQNLCADSAYKSIGDRCAVVALGRGRPHPRKGRVRRQPRRRAEPTEVENPLPGRTYLRLY